jgi:hypothetical protein
MAPTHNNVIVVNIGHAICAKATDVIFTKTPNAAAVKAADATSTEAARVASTEATHVTSAETAHTTTMSSTPSASTAGLCTGGKKAAGKHCACQNRHHSSSHDILHLRWADFPPQGRVRRWLVSTKGSQRCDGLEMGMLACRLY